MRRREAVLLIITVLVMMLAVACGKKKDEGVFRVGMEADYPPFNWTQIDDSKGAVPIDGAKEYAGGYDVEIAKR